MDCVQDKDLKSVLILSDNDDRVWDMPEEERKGLGTPLCRTPTSELLHMAATTLPSPNPPQPPHQVFPSDVPLTHPFPPPPPLPTDIAPPPLTEHRHPDPPQWPTFLQPPPPPPSSSSAPTSDRPPHSSASAPPPAPYMEPAGLDDLPAAALQWKEMLEGGWWNPTPQQLQNLASMGLLGLAPSRARGASESGLGPAAADSKQRPGSAPAFNTQGGGRGERKVDAGPSVAAKAEPGSGTEESVATKSVSGSTPSVSMKTEPADVPLSIADPSIIHSSLHAAPCSTASAANQPAFEAPHFGGGKFMEVKVASPAAPCYKGPVISTEVTREKSEAEKGGIL